jgi:hypothetical protein
MVLNFDLKCSNSTIYISGEEKDGEIVLKPITSEYIRNLRGMLKPEKGQKSALDILKENEKKITPS